MAERAGGGTGEATRGTKTSLMAWTSTGGRAFKNVIRFASESVSGFRSGEKAGREEPTGKGTYLVNSASRISREHKSRQTFAMRREAMCM